MQVKYDLYAFLRLLLQLFLPLIDLLKGHGHIGKNYKIEECKDGIEHPAHIISKLTPYGRISRETAFPQEREIRQQYECDTNKSRDYSQN
ncbi:hypothetical protein D3C81_766830 [compost metagenome]